MSTATPHIPPAGFYPLGDPPVRCERCRWPIVLDYDGPNTGWSHLYPGLAEGTVACIMPPPEDIKSCGCYADDPDCPPAHAPFNADHDDLTDREDNERDELDWDRRERRDEARFDRDLDES